MPPRDFETTKTASGSAKNAGEPRYGWSRSRLYRLASEGAVKLVKVGGATFVDYASADAYMAGRPVACIRAPRGVS